MKQGQAFAASFSRESFLKTFGHRIDTVLVLGSHALRHDPWNGLALESQCWASQV
jgi:hypothetical protein